MVKVCYFTLQDLMKDARRLPKGWVLLHADEHCATFVFIEGDSVKIRVVIHADLSSSVRVLGMPAAHLTEQMEAIRLHTLLSSLSNQKLCVGVTDPDLQVYSKPPSTQSSQKHFRHTTLVCPEEKPITTSCVRSTNCRLLSGQQLCNQCARIKPLLVKKKTQAEVREQRPLHRNDALHTTSRTKLKEELKEMRKTNRTLEKNLVNQRTFRERLSHIAA